MRIDIRTADSIELSGERELIDQLESAGERSDGPVLAAIAIKDAAGAVRLLISAHTASEEDAVVGLLDERGFKDELVVDHEDENEDGSVECWTEAMTHPEFDYLYRSPRAAQGKK